MILESAVKMISDLPSVRFRFRHERRYPVVCRVLVALFVGLLLTVAAGPARADTLDKIIGFLTDAQVLDPSIKEAKPLIDCMIHSPPEACVNIKSIAEQQGKTAAKKYTPDDPTVKAAVDIVKAAYNNQWLKVLELTSTDLLVQIACKAGLSGTGPIGNFLCSSISGELAKLAKPVAEEVVGNYARTAELAWKGVVTKYLVEDARVAPTVTMVANENWIEFTLRYVVDYKARRATQDKLFTRILEEVDKSSEKIGIAAATINIEKLAPLDIRVREFPQVER